MSIIKNKLLMITGLAVTLLATILFFPVNIGQKYTCLFHRLFVHSHLHFQSGQELFHHYLLPYGLLWWASLAIFAGIVWKLRNWKKNSTKHAPHPGA